MRTPEQIERDIHAAFDELDRNQLKIWAGMSTQEKGRLIANMVATGKKMVFASTRALNPHLTAREVHQKAIARFMRFSEWEPEKVSEFKAQLDQQLAILYPDEASPDGNL